MKIKKSTQQRSPTPISQSHRAVDLIIKSTTNYPSTTIQYHIISYPNKPLALPSTKVSTFTTFLLVSAPSRPVLLAISRRQGQQPPRQGLLGAAAQPTAAQAAQQQLGKASTRCFFGCKPMA